MFCSCFEFLCSHFPVTSRRPDQFLGIYWVRSVGNRKSCIKIACATDIIVCSVCECGDLELPMDGIGTHFFLKRFIASEYIQRVQGSVVTSYL